MTTEDKLLGRLAFVARTFEGGFADTPFVLDMDANLHIGPADQMARDEHATIEVIFHFLVQTQRIGTGVRALMRDQPGLLDAFAAFDEARREGGAEEFRIFLFGTYDGDLLAPVEDDELPAGPCGRSVNEVKRRFYRICERLDPAFGKRELTDSQRLAAACFADPG